MEWLKELFVEHSALQAVVVVSLISTIGIGLGKIRFFGISLGTAFIFFVGILAGHFGLSLDPAMLTYAEFRTGDLRLRPRPSGGAGLLQFDARRRTAARLARHRHRAARNGPGHGDELRLRVSMPDMSGILCGATINTPALGAAQQTLQQMGIDANGAALSCAVAYPLGVVGVILAVVFLRKLFVRPCDMPGPDAEHRKNVFIASYHLTNPAVFGKSVHEIATQSHHHFRHFAPVARRAGFDPHLGQDPTGERPDPGHHHARRGRRPAADLRRAGDQGLEHGKYRLELRRQPAHLAAHPRDTPRNQRQETLAVAPAEHLRHQHQPRVPLGRAAAGHPDLRLQLGDRLTVVGEAEAIRNVEKILGNAVKSLNEPNLAAVFIGLILGLTLGSIPVAIPGISIPVKLGLAGGPIIVGILIGTFGPGST